MGGVQLKHGNNHIDGIIIKGAEASVSIGTGFSSRKYSILNVSGNGVLKIGNNVFINNGTKINVREKIEIGNDCIIGQDVLMYDHDHDYKSDNRQSKFKTAPIVIGDNVWIGSNVVILRGVMIGSNSVIAAGSIVNCDVPENTLFFRELGNAHMRQI